MSRRPSFQFYPADWRKESGLRLCSMGARGLWAEMLCIMHEGEPYGHLTYHGENIEAPELARLVGESPTAVKRWLKELASKRVYSTTDDGAIFSRRMVRDEVLRERRAEIGRENGQKGAEYGKLGADHGKKGGRPRKETTEENPGTEPGQKPPYNPRPSSSSSSASAFEEREQSKPTESHNSKPSLAREKPPPGITDAATAFGYVCRAADWHPSSDTQRQVNLSVLAGWLALGCSLELILDGIAKAIARQPGEVTKSFKRFDSTIRGMRRDQLGGELPITGADVEAVTNGLTKRMSVGG